jgi:hypothetical protein
MAADGKQIFRYDTFGSEDFWGGLLKLHQAPSRAESWGCRSGDQP